MKSRLSLKPGQKGTKLLTERFGNSLLYVRYRYDEERGVRLKTVELVIEEKPWQPSPRLRNGDLVNHAANLAGLISMTAAMAAVKNDSSP